MADQEAAVDAGNADVTRLHRAVTEAGKLQVDLIATGDWQPSRQNSVERLLLRDVGATLNGAATTTIGRNDDFVERYAPVLGATEALDRMCYRIREAFEQGQLGSESQRRTALSLVEDAAARLDYSLERLDAFATNVHAEEEIRARVTEFDSEVTRLKTRVREAASEFGVEGDKLEWGKYAAAEGTSADRWRRGAVAGLAGAFVFSMLGVLHALGESNEWQDVGLKALVTASLAGLGAYASVQSAEHRRESRYASRNAIDLATVALFVERLEPESRDVVLRAYGTQRFAQSPAVNGAADSAALNPVLLQFLSQAVQGAAKKS